MGLFSNKDAFLAKNAAAPGRLVAKFGGKVKRVVYDMEQGVTEKTPVNTGEALANTQWSMDAPDGELFPAQGTGDPGPTNSMALGTEPRRPENLEFSELSLDRLDFKNPFHRYIIQNNAEQAEGLELGLLPYAPFIQRSPAGMFAVTFAEVVTKLEGGLYNVA